MASNIGTLESFATANMKPVAGEQIDALWGQNVSGNTGYNYYKEIPIQSFSYSGVFGMSFVWMFQKKPSHNAFKVLNYSNHGSAGVTQYFRIFPAGTILGSTRGGLIHGTNSYTQTAVSFYRWDFDISSLTNDQYYHALYEAGNFYDVGQFTGYLVHGSSATY